jgi:hypothetical protein
MNPLLHPLQSRDQSGVAVDGATGSGADPSDRALIAAWGLAFAMHAAASRPPRVPLAVLGSTMPQRGFAPAFEAPPV